MGKATKETLLNLDIETYNKCMELQAKKDNRNKDFSICKYCGRKYGLSCICNEAEKDWNKFVDAVAVSSSCYTEEIKKPKYQIRDWLSSELFEFYTIEEAELKFQELKTEDQECDIQLFEILDDYCNL